MMADKCDNGRRCLLDSVFWVKCFDLPFSCIIIPSLSLFGGGKGEYVPNLWFRGYKGGKEDYVPDLRFPGYMLHK